MNTVREDRLYELLPQVYRMRDAELGDPLKTLLRVISEQVNLVEDDISQLYENWFIETCEDWVVPYLGDLVGYQPVHEAGELCDIDTPQGRLRNRIILPRREIANTIRYRRRKGALALLELLANDVANWPARAVEFYRLLNVTQAINHLQMSRANTVDVRQTSKLDLLDTPFDELGHSADIRGINSHHTQGLHNISGVGVFVWRLQSYSVTETPAYCVELEGPHCYTFSVLGNDTPLYVHPERELDPTQIATQFNLPVPIRRQLFHDEKNKLYGNSSDHSVQIWTGKKQKGSNEIVPVPVPSEQIISADLSDWQYLPARGTVAVDTQSGRMAFPTRQLPKHGVWVRYHYGFGVDIGGGEYERTLSEAQHASVYQVGKLADYATITAALSRWQQDAAENAIIEIVDSGVYVERITIEFQNGQKSLQLRAKNRKRPVIRLLDWQTDRPDSISITGVTGACFILDGIMITGRGMQVSGDLAELALRHSTLVPGWALDSHCGPQRSAEPSLEIFSPNVCVKISHSIVGSIQLNPSTENQEDDQEDIDTDAPIASERAIAHCQGIGFDARLDPLRVCINDSIIDACESTLEAIGAPGCPVAHACLVIVRSTVFGQVQVRSIELAENTVFNGRVTVARRQKGCVRFCYVAPGSRTPRRFRCQPDLVETQVEKTLRDEALANSVPPPTAAQIEQAKQRESSRVRAQFTSFRYGMPAYAQLANCCAIEIKTGADDESEMGVFHDLFQPQRLANLNTRLNEYLPARMDVGIIFAS